MTFIEAAVLATASGVLSMGVAALKWAFHTEARIAVVEAKLAMNA